ncbi:hypothetical protein TNCT_685711 [Trichonephila clavata]|uniref:Uncharacterized protein n=1 Tax=Trichonephila clavata TaxID=2740835 RepID=A0A8X6GRW5_TRICU|nr:hypothetical protein TNCT_685711 [Trichonephila clavata]
MGFSPQCTPSHLISDARKASSPRRGGRPPGGDGLKPPGLEEDRVRTRFDTLFRTPLLQRPLTLISGYRIAVQNACGCGISSCCQGFIKLRK